MLLWLACRILYVVSVRASLSLSINMVVDVPEGGEAYGKIEWKVPQCKDWALRHKEIWREPPSYNRQRIQITT